MPGSRRWFVDLDDAQQTSAPYCLMQLDIIHADDWGRVFELAEIPARYLKPIWRACGRNRLGREKVEAGQILKCSAILYPDLTDAEAEATGKSTVRLSFRIAALLALLRRQTQVHFAFICCLDWRLRSDCLPLLST